MRDLDDPTNIDTVPAMLTAGEFVLNKEATQMYGPIIEQMNQHGLQQRHAGNMNIGGKVKKIYEEGYTAPGQAYAIAKSMGYNEGGGVLSRDEFMKRLIPAAQKEGARLGIDPRIIMAQAIQETGWGQKVKGNNYFGIKSHGSDDGKNQTFTTHEVVDGKKVKIQDSFKGYDSLEDSVRGYGDFLQANPRYKDFLSAGDYDSQLGALGKSGYATDPNYSKNLGNIIGGKTFKGYYDNYVPSEVPEPTPAPPSLAPDESLRPRSREDAIEASRVEDYPEDAAPPVPNVAEMMQDPTGAALNAAGVDPKGFAGQLISSLFGGGGGVAPMPQTQGGRPAQSAAQIRAQTQAPAQPAFTQDEYGISRNRSLFGKFNTGGEVPMQYLRGGGKVLNPLWEAVDTSILNNNNNKPLNFKNAAQIAAQDEILRLSTPAPMQFNTAAVPQLSQTLPGQQFNQTAAHAGNRFNFVPPDADTVPEFDTLPPVPGSDEAILQGSSQNVENLEARQAERQQGFDVADSVRPMGWAFGGKKQRWDDNYGDFYDPATGALLSPDQFAEYHGLNPVPEPVPVEEAPGPVRPGTPQWAEHVAQVQEQNALIPEPEAPMNFKEAAIQAQQNIADGLVPPSPEAPMNLQNAADLEQVRIQEAGGLDRNFDPNAGAAPEIDTSAPKPLAKENLPATKAAVQETVANMGEPLTNEEAAQAETAGKNAAPGQVDRAKNIIKENFGDLFDKKELSRAALLFAGAMITGMSPQRALAFAGSNYINRIDAKEARQIKSAEEAAKAAQKRQPVIDQTKSKFVGLDGNKVRVSPMTSIDEAGNKIQTWVDDKGNPVNEAAFTGLEEVAGTPEYKEATAAVTKEYQPIYKDFSQNIKDMGENASPSMQKVGRMFSSTLAAQQSADWSRRNGVTPSEMSSLMPGIMQQMENDLNNGRSVGSVEPYLNEAYITAQIPTSPELVNAAPADKVLSSFNAAARRMGFEGSVAETSAQVMPLAKQAWEELSPEERERYAKRAKNTELTPFLLFMKEDLEV